jgi:hypothetical protein
MNEQIKKIRDAIEGNKQYKEDLKATILNHGKEIAGLVKKMDVEKIVYYARAINRAEVAIEQTENNLQELELMLQDAERKSSKLSVIAEALDEIFEEDMKFYHELKQLSRDELKKKIKSKDFPAQYGVIWEMDEAKAVKMFKQDLEFRFRTLENKIAETVGEVVDLKIERNARGTFDGWIKGTQGGANIRTIGAGGYNIIRFHYRTLIEKFKH